MEKQRCIANADSPREFAFLKEQGFSVISAGIHPWKADTADWAEMEPVLREAAVVGEIGLDSVWCNVDMAVQRQVFHRQLALAAQLKKPVILHTKGMEREVLDTIHQYPNRYLVHWYSCEEHLTDYIALGCWFTLGPDVRSDVAQAVPLDRLLIESDGLEGIAWAYGQSVTAAEYPHAMGRTLREAARLRDMDEAVLLGQMEGNLEGFLSATAGCFARL